MPGGVGKAMATTPCEMTERMSHLAPGITASEPRELPCCVAHSARREV